MSGREIDLSGKCGLYCGDCLRYRSRASALARDLIEELERTNFRKYAEVKRTRTRELNRLEECLDVLKAMVDLNCDTPCGAGGDGCLAGCEIKACLGSKGLDGCWQCQDMETCDKFDFLEPFHGQTPRENLKEIKRHGLNNWVRHRKKCYPWS